MPYSYIFFTDVSVSTDVSTTCTFSNSIDKVKEAIVETFAYKKDGESVKYYLNSKAEQVRKSCMVCFNL